MLELIALLVFSCFLILKGSEWITDASSGVASKLNTTNVAVGLLLVSFLLSLPELVIAISAISKGQSDISLGVAIGSVIVNLGLIIGVAAIIKPITVPRAMISRDAIFMLVATIVVSLIALEDGTITARDGAIFLLLFIPYIFNVYEQERLLKKKERHATIGRLTKTLKLFGKLGNFGDKFVIKNIWAIFLLGIAALLLGAEILTGVLISLSSSLNLPQLLVALTIGALGPSIPNLAVALQSLSKGKEYENLAVSETIGSNIFTLLITVGVIAMLAPITLDKFTIAITAPALILISFIFFLLAVRGKIGKLGGLLLLSSYILVIILEFAARSGYLNNLLFFS